MTNQPTQSCPQCGSDIPQQARKCRFCGEFLSRPPPGWDKRAASVIKYIGYLAAVLGLSATLREGYFFIQERQQARDMFQSYLDAAQDFRQLDNLEYARQALDRALAVYPNRIEVASARFKIAATHLLREADGGGAMSLDDQEYLEITGLVQDGFRLIQLRQPKTDRAELLTLLGRLLGYDRAWSDTQRVGDLFAEAYLLTPDNPEVVFRYGHWLLAADDPQPGFDLIQLAIALDDDNPFYLAELGEHLLEDGQFRAAIAPLRQVSATAQELLTLQQRRAVNGAKRNLAKWLLQVDKEADILQQEFFGLSTADRHQLIAEALIANHTNRELNYLAARFYHYHQEPQKALLALRNALYGEGSLEYIPASDRSQLPLYLELLTVLDQEPELRARVAEILGRQPQGNP